MYHNFDCFDIFDGQNFCSVMRVGDIVSFIKDVATIFHRILIVFILYNIEFYLICDIFMFHRLVLTNFADSKH